MFTSNVTAPYLRMVENKIPLMLRTSDGYSGKASPTGELAHVLFQVAGRMYDRGPVTAEVRSAGHGRLGALERLRVPDGPHARLEPRRVRDDLRRLRRGGEHGDAEVGGGQGYYPPMLSGVSVSAEHGASETLDDDDLVDDLQSIADVHSYAELETDARDHAHRDRVRQGLPVAPTSGRRARDRGSYDNWAGWDHWMDQHIGLKYVGSDSCAVSHQLNANLTARRRRGQRTTADYGAEKAIHWYTGYAGSMTWEYWVTGCPSYSTDSEADVCACHASNNDKIFLEETGANCAARRQAAHPRPRLASPALPFT
ncbi:hypothetical protein JL720_15748 [Aureococcus anophagefferens]|nr:hypothetical protein JL720_15748 [Aureococcus anophagefferens]